MKRSINYSHLIGLVSADVKPTSKQGFEVAKKEADLVCDLVFAPDKRTHLPSSDISVYLAPNTPVQVREFIKTNIMGEGLPRSSDSLDLDDDTIHELVRGSGETVEDYAQRVSRLMQSERSKVQEAYSRVRNYERFKNVSKSE